MNILGVSSLYHDAAACLVRDGEIVAAAQEERFSRVKGDARLPRNAMRYVLEAGGLTKGDIDICVYQDKPLTKFTRLLSTYSAVAPRGLRAFLSAVPAWVRQKAWAPLEIERALVASGYGRPGEMYFAEHHLAHAASAFYPSPYEEAAILSVDGVGEWMTTALGVGEGERVRLLYEQRFPHSIGLLYSAFTYFTGFKVNSGEYKLMGLAPYGEPRFVDEIETHLIDLREDGSFRLNMDYFGYLDGLRMTNDRFAALFGGPRRSPESPITRREMDLARSIQVVTEKVLLRQARYARAITGKKNLVMAGGCALNCVANGHIVRSGIFDGVFIQPAAGDAGGALGGALHAWHHLLGNPRTADGVSDKMQGAYLGPSYSEAQTRDFLDRNGLPYTRMAPAVRDRYVADAVANERVVGLFQGRMEYGPRALGHRSILADARSRKTQSHLNLATKFREGFRPFAPICRREDAADYFEAIHDSPYMLLVDQVRADRLNPESRRRPATDLSAPASDRLAGDRLAGDRLDRVDQHPALGCTGHHPRGLLGAHPDRRRRAQPPGPPHPDRVQGPHGPRTDGQHQLQRPQRAHRLRSARRLRLLHAHRHGRPGPRRLRAHQERPAGVAGDGRLARHLHP